MLKKTQYRKYQYDRYVEYREKLKDLIGRRCVFCDTKKNVCIVGLDLSSKNIMQKTCLKWEKLEEMAKGCAPMCRICLRKNR